MKRALLVVDLQNDFCPGGTLPVPEGDKVVPVLNKYIKLFLKKNFRFFSPETGTPKRLRTSKNSAAFGLSTVYKGQKALPFTLS
jgi:nicotinamidase-related amidase